MRISRPCYDKYHRCPGWAGGGDAEDLADTGEMDPEGRAYFLSNIFDVPDGLYHRWRKAQKELAKVEGEIWWLKLRKET